MKTFTPKLRVTIGLLIVALFSPPITNSFAQHKSLPDKDRHIIEFTPLPGQTPEESFDRESFIMKHRLTSASKLVPRFFAHKEYLSPIVPAFQVSEKIGGAAQTGPWIDRRGNFGYILVWWDTRRIDKEIWGQLLNREGENIGKNLLLIEKVRHLFTESRVRVDANEKGEFVVVWSEGYPHYDRPNIYARRFAADGTPRGNSIAVTQDNRPVNINPDVLLNDDGSFVCVWQRTTASFGESTILAKWFDANSQPTTEPLTVAAAAGANIRVAISGSGKGEAIIALANDDRRDGKMLVEKRDASGNLIWGPVMVNESSGAAFSPAIRVDENGNFIIAWTRYRLFERPSAFDAFVRFFDKNGNPKTSEMRLNDIERVGGYYFNSLALDYLNVGDLFAVWLDNRMGRYEVWGQRLSVDGARKGPNRKLSDSTAASPTLSLIDATGIVAWEDTRRGHPDIFVRKLKFSPDSIFAQAKLVNDDKDDVPQYSPKIAVNQAGEAVIAWRDNRDQFYAPYLQRFRNRGELVGHNERITQTKSMTSGPTVALNNRGDIIIGFSEFCAFASPSIAQILNFHQTIEPAPIGIAGTCDEGASPAEFLLKEDGSFIATWRTYRHFTRPGPKNAWDVFARFFGADGKPSSELIYVNTDTTAGFHLFSDIAGDAQGNFLIAWADPRHGGYSIYAQYFEASGNARGGNLRVSPDTTSVAQVAVAMDATGHAMIAWLGSAGDSNAVWVRRFKSEGQATTVPIRVNRQTPASKGTMVDVAMNHDGRAVVVWDGENGQQWDIFGQRFDAAGKLFGENFRIGLPSNGSTNQIDPQVAIIRDWIYVTWADDRGAEYAGNYDIWATILDFNNPTGIKSSKRQTIAENFTLYPNPFSISSGVPATISYQLPRESEVELKIYDVLGNEIKTLLQRTQPPGDYTLTWDGTTAAGTQVVSGIYFVHLRAWVFEKTRKILVIR
jgi:hypothetical protein